MDTSTAQGSPSTTATTDTSTTPRLFWVGMAVFLIVMVLLGFGSTYGRQLLLGKEISGAGLVETDWVIHLHAAVFVGWMVLLLGQTVLAAQGRVRAHMTLGSYGGLTLGIAVVLVGFLITWWQASAAVAQRQLTWAEWPRILLGTMPSWFGLLRFVLLMGLGLRNRRQPAAHKRYMTLATIVLVGASFSRMEYLLGSWSNTIGTVLMVAPLLAYDLYTEGRLHRATLIGAGVIGVGLVTGYL